MDDSMNDASLDREIESLLASEPSPEFVARVRTRVAAEPEPRSWRAPWMFAMAGAVAVIVVAVVVWPSREPGASSESAMEPPRVAKTPETVAPQMSVTAATPSPRTPSPRTAAARRAVAIVPVQNRVIDIDLPEVVIADNEVKTFAALVASVRQSRFDVAVPAAPDPDRPLEIKELPPVEPLEIEPIVRVAALQTEGERP
jgi:hypothetical protein